MIWRRLLLVFSLLFLASCRDSPPTGLGPSAEDLKEHGSIFKREILTVSPGVHVAMGYGLANSILLEGETSCVLVDTLESIEAAELLIADFQELTNKPVEAIIYTHHHRDHVSGAQAFAAGREIPIYAHQSSFAAMEPGLLAPVLSRRNQRWFGSSLDPQERLNAGIGGELSFNKEHHQGTLMPTQTFESSLHITLAGIDMQLVHAPGESADQLFVWLPKQRVLLCGDNYYRAFPQLYNTRETTACDVDGWITSLDQMRYLKPAVLVPGHTSPVSGESEIQQILTDYRDGIQYVHDQTIRNMNMGKTVDQVVAAVKLPPQLAASLSLQEFYGSVAWSVRAIFNQNLGWFDGNATNLIPLPAREKAQAMAALVGGAEALYEKAVDAAAKQQFQWCLELSDHLLILRPAEQRVTKLRFQALAALGAASDNANARHYYLTEARELQKPVETVETYSENLLPKLPMLGFFKRLARNLDPVAASETDTCVGFIFPDTGEQYSLHVRRGVAEVQPRLLENRDITVTVNSLIMKEMLAKKRSPAVVVARDMEVDGKKVELNYFLGLFKVY